jgi:hypothetical protein
MPSRGLSTRELEAAFIEAGEEMADTNRSPGLSLLSVVNIKPALKKCQTGEMPNREIPNDATASRAVIPG